MQATTNYPTPSAAAPAAPVTDAAGALRAARAAAMRMGNNKVSLRLGALGRTVTIGTESYEVSPIWVAVNMAATGALAYHGYRRHHGSWVWGLTWGILGGLAWPITGAVALAQGYGEPRGRG